MIENQVVMVTGSAGFLGKHLIQALKKKKCKIICLSIMKHDLIDLNVTYINGNLENVLFLQNVIEKHNVGYIFHLAAQSIVSNAFKSPISTFEKNIQGTCL